MNNSAKTEPFILGGRYKVGNAAIGQMCDFQTRCEVISVKVLDFPSSNNSSWLRPVICYSTLPAFISRPQSQKRFSSLQLPRELRGGCPGLRSK